MMRKLLTAAAVAYFGWRPLPLRADVKLPAIFSDNMVLQAAADVPIWGWAAPGEKVTIHFAGPSVSNRADAQGKWRLTLDLSRHPAAPLNLTVSGDQTQAPRTIRNVVVGEVWLAGGQSNMEKPLGPQAGQHPVDDWEQEVAHSANPDVRVFTVPFYYCQLANYGNKDDTVSERKWAEVREAQRLTLQAIPRTGMAILIDVGQAKDIHPTNKQVVGRRLALQALAQTYGRALEASGPLYESMAIEGHRIRLKFSHVARGLVAQALPDRYQPQTYNPATVPLKKPRPDSPLQGFAISGADGKFAWADATIDGDTVVVSAPEVPHPTTVRYAWADNPTCNLYNTAGLPASPFRTDPWEK